ncbi:histone-lysine N-methyltransferase, H3 lysine-79 specific-like [Agrilus planipennis]|uniref:Histone-lysine N-methyltransferase, H3 lysine-79 specific-like n=1 Tax=Agrilus planipennis TaxID=224129 RepID=A0A1W4WKF6_AGRPL|nr:histone-lysine N-methyltransferase, H3 lysine-79 specific-like [Agrilus planipennis]
MAAKDLFTELNKNLLQRVSDGVLAFRSIHDIYSKRLNDIKNRIENHEKQLSLEHENLKSITENVEPGQLKKVGSSFSGKKSNRPLRKILQDSNLNNQQLIIDCNNAKPVVKLEKLSEEFVGFISKNDQQQNIVIKQEKKSLNSMPPPTELPKRTRAKKNAVNDNSNSKISNSVKRSPRFTECDSDIMIEKHNISVVTLSDTSLTEEEDQKQSKVKVKNQRTKKCAKNDIMSDNEYVQSVKSGPQSKIKKEVESDHSETDSKSKTDSNEAVRVTRTKTRAKAKEQNNVESEKSKQKSPKSSIEFLKPEEIRSTRSKMRTMKQKKSAESNEASKERSEENLKRLRSPSSEIDTKTNEKQKNKPRKPKRVKSDERSNTSKTSSIYHDTVQEGTVENNNKENTSEMDRTYNVNNQTYNVQKSNKAVISENEKMNLCNGNSTVVLNKVNETVVLNKNDATVIVQKATVFQNPVNPDDLITDDESIVEDTPPVPKQQIKAKKPVKTTKQIFSPFSNSPVKKRVEAFEKLGAELNGSEIPVRITRTKKKAIEKEEVEKMNQAVEENKASKEKSKITTPLASHRFLPKTFNSVSKIQSNILQKNAFNESLISTKSASALKTSQNEYKERELKRREKEEEALRKREAILQAQIEEKRRKREEKQLKAQQQREALEKDKQKMLEETERLKEEKHKQLLAEKEEKQQRLREEANRKRMLALQKAKEKKKEEEMWKKMEEEEQKRKLEEEKKKMEWRPINVSKQNNNDDQPIYLVQEAPLLPTDDCYDSDDSRSNYKKVVPHWATKAEIYKMCRAMFYAGDQIKNSFFRCNAQSPDLRKIFYKIDSRKLKRTSSAVWHEPPRYTQLQRPNEI